MLPNMTWAELAKIIASMTPEQQAQPVKARSITQENCTNAEWDEENHQIRFQDYHLDEEALMYGDHTK